jgi:hypothetical protein
MLLWDSRAFDGLRAGSRLGNFQEADIWIVKLTCPVCNCNVPLTTVFEVGDIIHSHPEAVRADVELLAHDSNQEIPTYSKRRPP